MNAGHFRVLVKFSLMQPNNGQVASLREPKKVNMAPNDLPSVQIEKYHTDGKSFANHLPSSHTIFFGWNLGMWLLGRHSFWISGYCNRMCIMPD